MKELIEIQSELKAPKGQTNAFGKYKYRSCEDIMEALKPLLKKHKCFLNVTDEMIQVGDRIYVKATATIQNSENKLIRSMGNAREAETKRGMDESQITGAASSYARKYALNGLFCIDDTKDADTMDNSKAAPKAKKTPKQEAMKDIPMITESQKIWIGENYKSELMGMMLTEALEKMSLKSLGEMTEVTAGKWIDKINTKMNEQTDVI